MGHVWLIGMMGSGKTSVGRLLSERSDLPLYDTDTTVAANAGLTIPEIFDRLGEGRFRELESQAVRAVATLDDGVVSTGGGVVLEPSNVRTMRESGTTVFLDVDVDTLIARLDGTRGRPLVGLDPEARIREIAALRADTYIGAADRVVDGIGSLDEVADRVEAVCTA